MKRTIPIEQWDTREGLNEVWRGALNGVAIGAAIGMVAALIIGIGCPLGLLLTAMAGAGLKGALFGGLIGTIGYGAKYMINQLKPQRTITVDFEDERLLPPARDLTPVRTIDVKAEPVVEPPLAIAPPVQERKLLEAPAPAPVCFADRVPVQGKISQLAEPGPSSCFAERTAQQEPSACQITR